LRNKERPPQPGGLFIIFKAQRVDMTNAEQLEALRHWVQEGRMAILDVAFVRAYEEVRQEYVRTRMSEGKRLGNPLLNPSGTVAIGRLHQVNTTLVIFCGKAADRDNQSVGLRILKNSIVSDARLSPTQREKINSEFKLFEKIHGFDTNLISIRSKVYAHSDLSTLMDSQIPPMKLGQLLEHTIALTDLIRTLRFNSNLVPVGCPENPVVSDNSVSPGVYKFAHMNAVRFWTANFSEWGSNGD
jgi:hypothetical protein